MNTTRRLPGYAYTLVLSAALFCAPMVSFAASLCAATPSNTPRTFADVICLFLDLIQTLVPVIFGLMMLVFFWGLAKMILHAGDEGAREEGRHIMIWGIIGIFVAITIYAIVGFLYGSFGFSEALSFPPRLPRW